MNVGVIILIILIALLAVVALSIGIGWAVFTLALKMFNQLMEACDGINKRNETRD